MVILKFVIGLVGMKRSRRFNELTPLTLNNSEEKPSIKRG